MPNPYEEELERSENQRKKDREKEQQNAKLEQERQERQDKETRRYGRMLYQELKKSERYLKRDGYTLLFHHPLLYTRPVTEYSKVPKDQSSLRIGIYYELPFYSASSWDDRGHSSSSVTHGRFLLPFGPRTVRIAVSEWSWSENFPGTEAVDDFLRKVASSMLVDAARRRDVSRAAKRSLTVHWLVRTLFFVVPVSSLVWLWNLYFPT
jgi:hypothetical protein